MNEKAENAREQGTGHRGSRVRAVPWRQALVVLAGLAIARMDTRSHWDDTGMTAAALAVAAGLGAAAGVRPWLAAVLAGLPLVVAEWSGSGTILLVFLFPLAGALGGWFLRRTLARG